MGGSVSPQTQGSFLREEVHKALVSRDQRDPCAFSGAINEGPE